MANNIQHVTIANKTESVFIYIKVLKKMVF